MTDDSWGDRTDSSETNGDSDSNDWTTNSSTTDEDGSWGSDRADDGRAWGEPNDQYEQDRHPKRGGERTTEHPHGGVNQNRQPGPEPTSRLIAALVGGTVGFMAAAVMGVIPLLGLVLGPAGLLVGGGVAGYLRGSDTKESTITGGLAGALASVPTALLMAAFALLFGFSTIVTPEADGGSAGVGVGIIAIFGVFTLMGVAIAVVMSAVGGAIGAEITDREPPNE